MKETLKKSWWKVPLYSMVAGWISFQLKVRIGSSFAITKLPDGTVSVDNTRWMIMSGTIFLLTLIVGGFLFFRRMKKEEVFCSASVMVIFNVVGGLVAYFFQRTSLGSSFAVLYSEINEWSGFVSQLVYNIGLNQWISAIIVWIVPYLFVLFGKKST